MRGSDLMCVQLELIWIQFNYDAVVIWAYVKGALLFGRKYGMYYRRPPSSNHSLYFFFYFKIFVLIFLTNQAVRRMGASDGARTKIITHVKVICICRPAICIPC